MGDPVERRRQPLNTPLDRAEKPTLPIPAEVLASGHARWGFLLPMACRSEWDGGKTSSLNPARHLLCLLLSVAKSRVQEVSDSAQTISMRDIVSFPVSCRFPDSTA